MNMFLRLVVLVAALVCLPRTAVAQSFEIVARVSEDANDDFTKDFNESFEDFNDGDEPGRLTDVEPQAPRILHADQYLILRFYTQTDVGKYQIAKVSSASIQRIEFKRPRGSAISIPPSAWTPQGTHNVLVLEIPSDVTAGASHKDRISITVSLRGDQTKIFYVEYNATPQLYGAAGFWIPVGLFSSNLHEGPQGISFAVQPVNLAWGVKFLFGKASHFGVSVAGGWAITSSSGKADAPDSDPNAKGGFTLGAASGTLLLDFGSWVYLGGSYLADFRKDQADPGLALTLGFGPKLLGTVAGLDQ